MTFNSKLRCFFIYLVLFTIIGCTKKPKPIKDKETSKIGSIYTMQPLENEFPKLKSAQKQALAKKIESFYANTYVPNDFSGSFLVAKNGHIIIEKYSGFSNYQSLQGITAQTPIHIASLSKVLTATAVLLLVDSKKITLDQKVNTILKDFPYKDITVRTLLNHRSGLRNYSYFTDKKEVWNKKDTLKNTDLIPIINKNNITLEYKTDTHFAYCNTNYAFLALIIEKISGMPYPEAMNKLIFTPLQMKNTFVFNLKKHSKSACQSYKGNKIKYAYNYLDGIYGDKNIYTTPRDLLKFDMATYHPNFLNKNLLSEVFKGYSYESKGIRNYGLGIRMLEWPEGKKMFYHNGWWHGNTAAYIKLKDEKVTLICLSNKYSRTPYQLKLITSLFGEYPFKIKTKDEVLE